MPPHIIDLSSRPPQVTMNFTVYSDLQTVQFQLGCLSLSNWHYNSISIILITTVKNVKHTMAPQCAEYFEEDVKDVKPFVNCEICDKNYPNESLLKRHIRHIHVDKKVACDQCVYETNTKSNLMQHIKVVHMQIKYKCDVCDHESSSTGDRKAHVKSVHENIKYPCDICEKQFSRKQGVKIHIQTNKTGSFPGQKNGFRKNMEPGEIKGRHK